MNFRFHFFSSQQSRAASSEKAGPTETSSFAPHWQQFHVLQLYVAPGMCRRFLWGYLILQGKLQQKISTIFLIKMSRHLSRTTQMEKLFCFTQQSHQPSCRNPCLLLVRTAHRLFSLLPKPHSFRKEPIQRNLRYHCGHFSCDAKPQERC